MTILTTPKNVYFFGNQGLFSASILNQILQRKVPVSRIVCAGAAPAAEPEKVLPVTPPTRERTLATLANTHDIQIEYVSSPSALALLTSVSTQEPDFILVACFPYLLPASIISWTKSGCLNIHPSLLPKYRGPDPIFWQLYNNEPKPGVTLHYVTSKMDAGPIISQITWPYTEGDSREKIEDSLTRAGADLFASFVVANDKLHTQGTQQTESDASYYPFPETKDYLVPTTWSAKHAFNFINATSSPNGHYIIQTKSSRININSAVEYSNNKLTKPAPLESSDELLIQFSPGTLRVKLNT